MTLPNQHQLFDFGAGIIAGCSILHTFLPPWDFLNDFPTAQKYYKAFVYMIGYIAVNGRSTVYRQISMQNPQGVNAPNPVTNPEQKKVN